MYKSAFILFNKNLLPGKKIQDHCLMKYWLSKSSVVFSIPGFGSGLSEMLWVVLQQATQTCC